MLGRVAVDEVNPDIGVVPIVGPDQFGKKTGSQRRIDTHSYAPVLAASNGSDVPDAFADLSEHNSRAVKKTLPSDRQADATTMPLEKGCTEPIFKITDGTADRGLLNAQCCTGFAQAAILGGSHEVAEMAELYLAIYCRHDFTTAVWPLLRAASTTK